MAASPTNTNQRRLQQQQQQFSVVDELMMEILARLPIKSLIRFRCVCKSWSALLSQPYFIRLYSQLSPPSPNPALLIQLADSNVFYVDIFSNVAKFSIASLLNDDLRIKASHNGLFCCQSLTDTGVYYVCNPLTRNFRLLPRVNITGQPPSAVGLVSHPTSSFKFNVLIGGYLETDLPRDQYVCLLFDSETDSWNRIVSSLGEEDSFGDLNVENWNNHVVFSGNDNSLYWLSQCFGYIHAFDLDDLVLRKVSRPRRKLARLYMMEMEGLVAFVEIEIDGHSTSVWVLKEGDHWVLEKNGELSGGSIDLPVSLSNDTMLFASPTEVSAYDWTHNEWKRRICAPDPPDCSWKSSPPWYFYTRPFRSTLFPC